MADIVKRAKLSIDPTKYNRQFNWAKDLDTLSDARFTCIDNCIINKEKKVTSTAKIFIIGKSKPGPHHYKNVAKHKIPGFYGVTEGKQTYIESHVISKNEIPASSKYESRGKSMAELSKIRCVPIRPSEESDDNKLRS